ncbi:NUDIX hydrolase [Desulfonatronospira sp. MSAO_Bac3]|uniref:NUDIX hydrolase n=1 Tax=Desulfonatronospira sp. MSAO_Bac3 TaxID=2293857 RepID=UPI000FF35991|nr:NUDIX hydrolase [Desulfonatronospira sp. MSAO_Bac3]RQD73022.1 MAG: NUDIX domain-containing protein [Desulfonatronospira sp. MSAO_Bac3]
MSEKDDPASAWLRWAREIQAISGIGLLFSKNHHDEKNFSRLQEIAAEMAEMHSNLDYTRAMDIFQDQSGYVTVKVDVRGAVIQDGRIMLVKEIKDGLWCLPGGWADVGETPSEMVAREVWEESGYNVVPERLVGVYDANRGGRPISFFHAYKIVFMCRITGGHARTSPETSAVDFFDFDDLPVLSSNRTNERHLEHVRACLMDPQRPAAFD